LSFTIVCEVFLSGIDSFVLSRVLGGAAEFRTYPADHYRALAGGAPLVWADDLEAWVCVSNGVVSEVLRDPARYHRAPAWEPEDDVPHEVQILRNTWLEFRKGVAHRTARMSLMSSVAHAHGAHGWSALTASIERLITVLSDQGPAVDLVPALVDPLWQALLSDWFGLDEDVIADEGNWLAAVAEAVSGRTDAATMDVVAGVIRRIAASVRAVRVTGRSNETLLDGVVWHGGSDVPDMVVAAQMLNLILDANPVPEAAILCVHDILTDGETTAYLTDRAAANDIEAVRRGLTELFRRDPVQTFTLRFATEDHVLAGRQVARHDCMVVVLGAANNDPRAHDAPDKFDPGRASTAVSFGLGPHSCIGRRYTIDVLAHVVVMLLRRFPRMSLADGVQWADEAALRRLVRCPVRVGDPT
jgi:cytochrome P450